ncbi:hypothetical protein HBA43_12135 [Providencia rettgeri]|uniref:Fimbrial protein n=2 Tax=Providencia TaxID=586 RepID=A0AA42FMR6_9GAMM|nr:MULTISPECIES: hypothetical protein [Providencia]EJD6371028.1 hypothetical protein [Providencia rettgeri]EJD6411765.1 hypothetical protein [Providencia rettgeri]EJD6663735.1 hypothetical protein [Providencia rettgeri]ELR5033248.1 hypothetical protein [Providencia rettgeri]ELR5097518.1 hypothetical protein [Providencia rettgeri]
MKYFSVVFFSLFISLSSVASQYDENRSFPSHDVTSAIKMDSLSGKLHFKVGLMYSPCVILDDEYNNDIFFIELEQCLVNNKNIKIPLQAKAKLIEKNNITTTVYDIYHPLYSGKNILYIQNKNTKGSSAIMELNYD